MSRKYRFRDNNKLYFNSQKDGWQQKLAVFGSTTTKRTLGAGFRTQLFKTLKPVKKVYLAEAMGAKRK